MKSDNMVQLDVILSDMTPIILAKIRSYYMSSTNILIYFFAALEAEPECERELFVEFQQ